MTSAHGGGLIARPARRRMRLRVWHVVAGLLAFSAIFWAAIWFIARALLKL